MIDNTTARNEQQADRQLLLGWKLGSLLTWQCPKVVKGLGPFEPAAFDDFARQRQELVDACAERLETYSDDDVSFIRRNLRDRTPLVKEWSDFLSGEIHALRQKEPPWYAGGLGHPDHIADFDHWTKMLRFSLSELTCLSVGIRPDDFDLVQLETLSGSKERSKLDPVLAFLVQRFELLHRTFSHGSRNANVYTKDFIAWAERIKLKVHPDFIKPLKRLHQPSKPAATPQKVRKEDSREATSVAKIIIVLAMKKFRYDPKAPRSDVPKKIADIAAEYGVKISAETVLKYLREGAKALAKTGQAE